MVPEAVSGGNVFNRGQRPSPGVFEIPPSQDILAHESAHDISTGLSQSGESVCMYIVLLQWWDFGFLPVVYTGPP